MNIPRIVIAGTNSGCGKTTIAAGLMAAFTRRGLKVQPYKVGPDFIDPMFHRFVTGRDSRNLDAWMLPEDILRALFLKNAVTADVAVVEGVMGLYDGLRGTSWEASTAHVAQLIESPVLLVVNAAGMSLSSAALIKGYQEFLPEKRAGAAIRAVILNNIKNESHYGLVKKIIEAHNGIKVVGYLPPLPEVSLPSRHLGLIPQVEQDGLDRKIDLLVQTMEKTVDLASLLTVAREASYMPAVSGPGLQPSREKTARVKIGVAFDQAFNFYYRDNLDLLEETGAELAYFSPMQDTSLPPNLSGLYLGGGYPEIFARQLQDNAPLRLAIRNAVREGMPVYAECGGMMYLCDAIVDCEGSRYEMCGIFPYAGKMTTGLKHFGYITATMTEDNILGPKGEAIRGHEFHYSELVPAGDGFPDAGKPRDSRFCFQISKTDSGGQVRCWEGGLQYQNTLAGYPHLHFWSNPRLAATLIQNCRAYREGK